MTTARHTIAGHHLILTAGKRYRATQPFASQLAWLWLDQRFTVEIESCEDSIIAAWVAGLTWDEADEFIAAFHEGTMAEQGRLWE